MSLENGSKVTQFTQMSTDLLFSFGKQNMDKKQGENVDIKRDNIREFGEFCVTLNVRVRRRAILRKKSSVNVRRRTTKTGKWCIHVRRRTIIGSKLCVDVHRRTIIRKKLDVYVRR